jgi:RNA polymerase sigma-70 factor (ECF subfamily)
MMPPHRRPAFLNSHMQRRYDMLPTLRRQGNSESLEGRLVPYSTDEQLIARYRSGDSEALNLLILRHRGRIYNLAYRLAGNREDAEDITSETFLRLCLRMHSIQNALSLTAWINRVVANVYIDMFRRSRRFPAISLDALPERAESFVLQATCYSQYAPELKVEAAEFKVVYEKAVAALPRSLRPVLVLYHDSGWSYEEIAEALQIPLGTVKSRLNSARMKLRDLLGPYRSGMMN